MVRYILRFEGLLFFLLALYWYNAFSANWLLFVSLLITPDISMIGYAINRKYGALTYNLVHNYALALVLLGIGILLSNRFLILYGIVLVAHVGLDRFLGFGLKYPASFKHTHLQKV